MVEYAYEIERAEDGTKIMCNLFSSYEINETNILFIADIGLTVSKLINAHNINRGILSEIKVNRNKDGSFFVSVTGAQDRIFAKVWRCDN